MSTLRTHATTAQCSSILRALRAGRALTPVEALQDFGRLRLAARIYDLRQDGHDIVTFWQQDANKRWAVYRLLRSAKQSGETQS